MTTDHQPTITRAMTQEAVRALGLDPTTVSAVTLEPHTVTVTHLIPATDDGPITTDRTYEIED